MSGRRQQRVGEAGFTLIETLIAMTLTVFILATLATLTAQWMPNWNRGFTRVQRMEVLNRGLERIVADLAAAEFVTANAKAKHVLFDGSELSVALLRPAIGPNTQPGLEFVRIGMTSDNEGPALVRTRAPFTILPTGMEIGDVSNFGDPVVLLRSPYRTVFSYAGADNVWRSSWHDAERLPSAVRVSVYNAATETALAISTATLVHVNTSAECAGAKDANECVYGDPKSKQNAQ